MCQPDIDDYETNSSWFASALDSALDSDQTEEPEQNDVDLKESEDN